MSQLNSENNINKTKSTAKKTFFMLLIFAVICAGVTTVLIYNSLNLRKQNELSNADVQNSAPKETAKKTKSKKSNVEKLKLTDRYNTNGITQENKKISLGDVVYEYEDNIERKLEITYVQIDGLKNTTIQDKINKEIENTALSYRNDAELADPSIHSIYVYATVTANFSDVLSVNVNKSVSRVISVEGDYEKYEYKDEYTGLNYNLATGEKIEFKDFFTDDAPIKNIISQAVYEDLAREKLYNSDGMDLYMDEIDYSDIEAKSFKVLSKFEKNQNPKFYFYPNSITFTIDDENYLIKAENFYEYVAIYSRFKSSNNLYKDESIVNSDNYVFTDADMSDRIYETKRKTDNFYYEIFSYDQLNQKDEEKSEKYLEKEKELLDVIYDKINSYAIKANENKDRGYIFSVMYSVLDSDIYDENNELTCNYTGYLCSMSKDYYNNNLEELIAKERRSTHIDLSSADYSYIDSENVEFEEEIYRYFDSTSDDGEHITTKEDRLKLEQEFY